MNGIGRVCGRYGGTRLMANGEEEEVATEFPLGELDSVEYYTLFHFIVRESTSRKSHYTILCRGATHATHMCTH